MDLKFSQISCIPSNALPFQFQQIMKNLTYY